MMSDRELLEIEIRLKLMHPDDLPRAYDMRADAFRLLAEVQSLRHRLLMITEVVRVQGSGQNACAHCDGTGRHGPTNCPWCNES